MTRTLPVGLLWDLSARQAEQLAGLFGRGSSNGTTVWWDIIVHEKQFEKVSKIPTAKMNSRMKKKIRDIQIQAMRLPLAATVKPATPSSTNQMNTTLKTEPGEA